MAYLGERRIRSVGIRWDDFDEALSAVRDIGPGGHYLGHAHTLEKFKDAFFMPEMFDNNSYEQWVADGSVEITERALRRAKSLLDVYEEPKLDPATDEALRDYIDRREREIPAVEALNTDSEAPTRAALKENKQADWVIIGAGFTGLSAALRLAELHPGDNVVVLEATGIADGPAGRNSGFMIDLPHDLTSHDYSGNAAKDQRDTRLNRAGINYALAAKSVFDMSDEAYCHVTAGTLHTRVGNRC